MKLVPNSGPEGARIVIVGEAPGEHEEREGRPFVGPAGGLLRGFLMELGIDPEEVFYANICQVRPPANKLEKFFHDGGFPNELVLQGYARLEEDLGRIQPNVVVAAGNFALWALTGKARWVDFTKDGKRVRGFTGIQDWRGSILPATLDIGRDLKVLPTYHPAYILREGMSDHGTFKTDLARLKEEREFPELRWPEKEITVVAEQPYTLLNYHDVLKDEAPIWGPAGLTREDCREVLLSDLETPTTLDIEYIGSKLLCVGLTNSAGRAFVYPTETIAQQMHVFDIINATKRFNAQNSMFDASILEWHYGVKLMPKITFDTMVAAYSANIELPKGLDYLCSIYTRQPYYKGMVDWNQIKKGQQDIKIVYAYNGIDVWAQHEIMEEQLKHDLNDEATAKIYSFGMALLQPLWEMSKRGIRVDLELMSQVSQTLDGEAAAKALDLMLRFNLPEPINVKSTRQVADLLFNKLGLEPLKMNKTGPAVDDKTLAALQIKATNDDQRDAVTLIRQIRNARDLKSKFFNIEFDPDGRMRGHYDPTKTVTGRLASRKFYPTGRGTNQQNIPRDKRARRAFLADPKKVFLYCDLEKAESLVVAHLTGDPRMLFDHSPGQNAHRNLGSELFGKPGDDLDEDEYYLSKKTRHAGNYMQGWMTFMRNVNQDAHKTGVSVDAKEAKYFINTYRQLHPGLPSWWKGIEQALYRGRTLQNLVGRHRTFYGHIKGLLPEAVAFTPQSTVGDVLNIGFLNLEGVPCFYSEEKGIFDPEIHAELVDCGAESLQQIHDAVGMQVNAADLDRAVPLIKRAMSIPLRNPRTYEDFIIPVEIAADVDPERVRLNKSNWGDVKKYA